MASLSFREDEWIEAQTEGKDRRTAKSGRANRSGGSGEMTCPLDVEKLVVEADGGGPKPRQEKERHISQRNQAEAGAIDEEDVGRLRSMMGRQPTGLAREKKRAKKPGGEGETSTMAPSSCRASTSASKRVP